MPSSVAIEPESSAPTVAPVASPVIEALQESVRAHWAAIHVYSLQAAHFERWGYSKLAEAASADVKEEQEHLARLLNRLEFFDVAPKFYPVSLEDLPRHDFSAILKFNLTLERTAAAIEQAGVAKARANRDEITAEVFEENLKGSEDAVKQITAIQRVITQIGLDNFLADKL